MLVMSVARNLPSPVGPPCALVLFGYQWLPQFNITPQDEERVPNRSIDWLGLGVCAAVKKEARTPDLTLTLEYQRTRDSCTLEHAPGL